MTRRSVRKAYAPVRPDETAKARMLENILSASSETPPAGKDDTMNRRKMKPVLIAAVIALMLLLMGSATVIQLTIAESPLFDYPLTDGKNVAPEDIHLSVSDVSSTGLHVSVSIDGVVPGEMSIYILSGGPFTLDKQTGKGWEPLPLLVDDPKWDADHVLTDGSNEWFVNWSAVYGVLEPGTYRYNATVLEGNAPTSVEFTVDGATVTDLSKQLKAILDGDAYYIRYTIQDDFGSLENLTRDQKSLIESEDAVWVYEYWKSEEDLMQLIYRDDALWIGMMYKDGTKYTLDHEGDDHTNPVIGWNPWPDLDMNRLTNWISTLTANTEGIEDKYAPDGSLASLSRVTSSDRYNSYDMEVTHIETWEIITTDLAETAAKFAEQNVDTAQVFTWEEDQKKMKALDVPFVNTSAQPVATASEAIDCAMAECTVEHDKIVVYRDEAAGMWKVEFQILYGYQGYQYVYLDDNGITQMVSAAGSKEEAWKELYPDP